MSSIGNDDLADDPREQLLQRQKVEKKDLQTRIQKMKQTVPKNDKRRRKEMVQEIEELEAQLKQKHAQELQTLDAQAGLSKLSVTDDLKRAAELVAGKEAPIADGDDEDENAALSLDGKHEAAKVSKAQRRREKKEREQLEREERIKAGEQENATHVRRVELEQMSKRMRELKLRIYDIPSDGDCMYRAIEHQLRLGASDSTHNVNSLRKLAADTLRAEKAEYIPFLPSKSDDQLMSDEEFELYCEQLEKTKVWGGNVELQVLARALNREIHVIQANGPLIKLSGRQPSSLKPILLSYHRYAYQLGEHYNSLLPIDADTKH